MMIYQNFAFIYDQFMENVQYQDWADFVEEVLNSNEIKGDKILELACGTGNVTGLLRKKGYDMTGIDISEDMLTIAQEKSYENNLKIKYLKQDMRTLNLNKSKYDAVVSFCDGINYIIEEEDLGAVFENVYKHLNDEGIFIFDISTEYKLKNTLGQNTFAETSEDSAYIWENYYDERTRILEFDLNIFIEEDEMYTRHFESHRQKAHRSDELCSKLEEIGFKNIKVYGSIDFSPEKEDSERIYICVQK